MGAEKIELAYGRKPLEIDLPPNMVGTLGPNEVPAVENLEEAIREALKNPIGTKTLPEIVKKNHRVAIVVSDRTRMIPRRELVLAILKEIDYIPDERICLVIANGNHPQSEPTSLSLGDDLLKRFTIVSHDPQDWDNLIDLGNTSAGVNLRINRAVAEADVKILTGQIKPHYFAGYSGGAKGLLPGVSSAITIGANHGMKVKPRARLGIINNNPTRMDMEEAARIAGVDFILNIVLNYQKKVAKVVAGDVVEAHREAVKTARKVTEVPFKKKADIVIVSETLPMSMNLYQTSKLVAPAAKLLNPGGVVILAGECHEGTGQLDIVNNIVYEMGLKNYLPEEHTILLVSAMSEEVVNTTFCPQYVPSYEKAFEKANEIVGKQASVCIIPRGGDLIPITGDEAEGDW